MKTRHIFPIILLVSLSIYSCKNISNNETVVTETYTKHSEIYNYVLDSVLCYYPNYSICGNFCYDLNDSVLTECLTHLDSIVTDEDIETMIQHYNKHERKNLSDFIDTSIYTKITVFDNYSNYKFYKLHFAISPVLISNNGKIGIVYLHAYLEKAGQSTVFMVFKLVDNKWSFKYPYVFESLSSNYSSGFHYHDYTLVLPHELDSCNLISEK